MLNAEVIAGVPDDIAQKLDKLIHRYLDADTTRKRTHAKKALIAFVCDRASIVGNDDARTEFWKVLLAKCRTKDETLLPDELLTYFNPRGFYEEGDRVIGWWDDGEVQIHAEELPLIRCEQQIDIDEDVADTPQRFTLYVVSLVRQPGQAQIWRERGFESAEFLPTVFDTLGSAGIVVYFPRARSQFFAEYGYALPCQLQWCRDSDGLFVTRSIIEHGFWQAWKWYGAETKWWYLENRPELFADFDWWGESATKPVRYEPTDNPYAAVLGGFDN